MSNAAVPSETRRFLALLAQPGDVFELRGLARVNGQQHVTSGYFDDIDKLIAAAGERSGKDHGVYVTINPVLPALLSRAPKNTVRRAGNGDTTSDRDVRTRRSILIDIDPVRPAGISSTDEEHQAAIELALTIRARLLELDWPSPIVADSGNGGHLIYAVDLPVDDGGLVKRVLERLSKQHSTASLKVDEKVFNAARISKIYGTLTRKGEDTADRPHRLAKIVAAPDRLEPVSRALLEAFAPITQRDPKPSNVKTYDGPRFDIDSWIAEHLPDAIPQSWTEGRKWLLPECPFNSQHDRKEAFITEKHSGQLAAGCLHESCFRSWHELRERFEPEAYQRKNGNHDRRITDRQPPPEVIYQAEDYAGRSSDDVFADRDAEPSFHDSVRNATDTKPARPKWWRAPELVDEVWKRKDEPWVSLQLAGEELVRVRAGGIAVMIGGSGSGKSSLVSNLLIDHARNSGPAIALSIELPADELAARIVGIQCDASWEQALRGQVERKFMEPALAMDRLYVLDRKNATIENLIACAKAARDEYPGQPILAAIDYAQLIHSKEREVRLRVADAFERIDDAAREQRFVAIAVSQMSRASATSALSGEKIGEESASLGAESAAIERFATVTMTIGKRGEKRADGTRLVELSIGKGRMSDVSDSVRAMSYEGRTGRWRTDGESMSADAAREARDVEKQEKRHAEIRNLLVGAAHRSKEPLSKDQLQGLVAKGKKTEKLAAIHDLVMAGELVEVARTASRSRSWLLWTLDRARDAKSQLVRDMPAGGHGGD